MATSLAGCVSSPASVPVAALISGVMPIATSYQYQCTPPSASSVQVRLTCEENLLFPNIPEANLQAMLAEPLFLKYKVNPGEHRP